MCLVQVREQPHLLRPQEKLQALIFMFKILLFALCDHKIGETKYSIVNKYPILISGFCFPRVGLAILKLLPMCSRISNK